MVLCYNDLDLDECGTNNDDCDRNAICSNSIGTFTCACNSGFSGDGRSCAGSSQLGIF